MSGFNLDRFREVFNGLDDDTRIAIQAKAGWERMSLSAVMHDWWPELWAQVAGGPVPEREGDGR